MTHIPNHVHQIAAQIAQSPVKVAAFKNVLRTFPKQASFMEDLFGSAKSRSGVQTVLGGIAGSAGGALLGAAGAAAVNTLNRAITGKPTLTHEEEAKELGRLNARATFAASRSLALMQQHDSILSHLMKNDDLIKDAPKQLVTSSFKTMAKFAPNLAADENAARSFLRTSIESGSGPSFATLQTLADAERSVQQAGGISLGK